MAALAAAGLVQAAAVAVASNDAIRLLDSVGAAAAVGAAYVLLGVIVWFGFGDAKFAGALAVSVAIYAGLAAIYIMPLAIVFTAIWRLLFRTARGIGGLHAHGPAIALSLRSASWWPRSCFPCLWPSGNSYVTRVGTRQP